MTVKTLADAFMTRVAWRDPNIAADINNMQDALEQLAYATIAQAAFANVETLAGNKTLTDANTVIQMLNPNGANRVVTLPALANANHPFLIGNTNGASYTLDVQSPSAVSVRVVGVGKAHLFVSDGTQWKVANNPNLTAWAAKTAPSGTVLGTTDAQTLTNKRITARTGTVVSSATPTINTDDVDFFSITALAVDITSMTTNLSGTPTEGQFLRIAVTGTATRAITWGASFEDGVPLPTTTNGTSRLEVGFIWNTVTSKWRCIGYTTD